MILQVDTRSRTVDNFKKLCWIQFYGEVKMNKCILIFKKINGDVPSYIDELFTTNTSIHGRQTRPGGYNLVCPRYNRSSEVGKFFTISSIKLWNSIPSEIKRKQSIASFESALRKHFMGTSANIDSFSVNIQI